MTYGSTTPDAIAYLLTGSSVNPVSESSTQASSVQTALSNRPFYNYVWANATGRTGQAGMRPGDLGFQTDTGVSYVYISSSSGWQPSATGVGHMLSGSVLVTGLTAFSQSNQPTAGWKGSAAITFPTGYFAAAPNVMSVAATSGAQSVNTSVGAISSTGFTLYLSRTDSGTNTTAYWFACL
jgi:hypothetical protein